MAQQLTTKFREDEANEITENVAAVVDSLFYLLGEYLRAQIAARAENMAWGGGETIATPTMSTTNKWKMYKKC